MVSVESAQRSRASRLFVGSIGLAVALAVVGLFCVPASPVALARPDLRLGIALLCAVLFAFAVGYLAHGRWFVEIESSPWRADDPSARKWGRWVIDLVGIALLMVAGVTGLVLSLRSVLMDR
jgi:hypothetical protein